MCEIWLAGKWCFAKMWDWPVASVGSLTIYGLGVAALFGDEYVIASIFFLLGVAWLTAKAVSWEEIKNQENRHHITLVFLLGGLVWLGLSGWWVWHRKGSVIQTAASASVGDTAPPEFSVRPETKIVSQPKNETRFVYVTAIMDISNRGGPGTVANISLELHMAGRIYSSLPVYAPPRNSMVPLYFDQELQGPIKLRGYQYWTYAVGEKALQRNSSTPVWAVAKYEGVTPEEIEQNHPMLTVKVTDVQGRVSSYDDVFISIKELQGISRSPASGSRLPSPN